MFKIFNSVYSPLTSRSESPHSDDEHRRFIDGKPCCEDGSSHSQPRLWDRIPHFSIILPWVLAVLNFGLFLNQYLRSPSELACARLLSPYCMSTAKLKREISANDAFQLLPWKQTLSNIMTQTFRMSLEESQNTSDLQLLSLNRDGMTYGAVRSLNIQCSPRQRS